MRYRYLDALGDLQTELIKLTRFVVVVGKHEGLQQLVVGSGRGPTMLAPSKAAPLDPPTSETYGFRHVPNRPLLAIHLENPLGLFGIDDS